MGDKKVEDYLGMDDAIACSYISWSTMVQLGWDTRGAMANAKANRSTEQRRGRSRHKISRGREVWDNM